MLSQTGYGRATNETELGSVIIEIKAVNGKFLDIALKAPRAINPFEEQIKKEIMAVASRGTVEVRVNLNLTSFSRPTLNFDAAKEYVALSKELSKKLKVKDSLNSAKLLVMNDVISQTETEIEDKKLWELVGPALKDALKMFKAFKTKEGKNMQKDLQGWADVIAKELTEVKVRVPQMLKENQEKMRTRIKELLGSVELDEAKLANEIAFFVDRVDINEEIKRLESHLGQYNLLMAEQTPGKQIEFLSQEMTREINTMGSKSNDIEITKHVLNMKNANEKIKEQMRNIE